MKSDADQNKRDFSDAQGVMRAIEEMFEECERSLEDSLMKLGLPAQGRRTKRDALRGR